MLLPSNLVSHIFSKIFISYENIAFLMLLGLINSIVYAYGQAYYYSQLSHIVLYVSTGIALYISFSEIQNLFKRSSEVITKTVVITLLTVLVTLFSVFWWIGYFRSTSVIYSYKGIPTFYLNAEGTYKGVVTEVPKVQKWDDKEVLQLTVALTSVKPTKHNIGANPIRAEGTVIVYVPVTDVVNRTSIKKNDSVTFKGKVTPLQYSYEEGRIDLRSRHIASNIVGRVYDAKVDAHSHATSSKNETLYATLAQIFANGIDFSQNYINKTIESHVSPQSAAILKTLVLGGNYADIDDVVMKSFAFTGLIHILSVSGSHVAILFSTIYLFAKVLGIKKKSCASLAMVVVIFYAVLVGFNAPIVRSAIMGVITSLALMKGRTYIAKQALTLSASGLLIVFPLEILDISFQLSYLATYGLIFFAKSISVYLYKLSPLIRYPLAMCFSAQLLVLPLQIYYFHFFSLLSFVAAIFIGPLLELIILLLFLYILLSVLYVPQFLWTFLELLLKVALFGNVTIASLPMGAFWVGMGSSIFTCAYYALLIVWYRLIIVAKDDSLRLPLNFHPRRVTILIVTLVFFILTANQWAPFFTNERRIHIVPLTNKQVVIVRACQFPYKEKISVYMDIKKGTLTQKEVEDMKMSLRYVGKNKVDEFVVINMSTDNISKKNLQALSQYWQTSIQSSSKNEVYVCLFSNRQNGQKNLKLNGKLEQLEYLFGSSNIANINKILLQDNPSSNVVFWPKRREQNLLDKESPNLYVVGSEWVPDFYL